MRKVGNFTLGVGFLFAITLFASMGSTHAADMNQMKNGGMMVREEKMMGDKDTKTANEENTMTDKGETMKSEEKMKNPAKGNNEGTAMPYTHIPKMGDEMEGGKK